MSDTRCTGGGTGCLTVLAILGAMVFLAVVWFHTETGTRNHPFRVAACRTAGGDGRYEMRGGILFPHDLWCAHGDGTVFPVLDPQGIDDNTPPPPPAAGPELKTPQSVPQPPPVGSGGV